MQFTVTKENLKSAISKVSGIVSSKVMLPALNNILIEAEGDTVSMTASDLEISIKTTISALIMEPGETTLPAKKLQQIANDLPAGDVTITTNEDEVATITCQRSLFKLHGLAAVNYQKPEEFQEDWTLTMPALDLVKSLAKVSYAKSEDEQRRVLNGVLFSVRGGVLTFAATDGRRLALVEKTLEAENLADGDIILPTKVTQELSKTLDLTGDVVIKISASSVLFASKDTTIISKLVEGVYPNYRQVIPESFTRQIEIPRVIFTDVLRRVSIVVQESGASVKFSLADNLLTISASNPELGEASEPIDIEYTDTPLDIAFNPQFVNEPLKLLDCDKIIMKFSDDLSPVEIAGDEGFLYIIMPMRG